MLEIVEVDFVDIVSDGFVVVVGFEGEDIVRFVLVVVVVLTLISMFELFGSW